MLMGVLITFLVVILILYLINLLPLDGRAKQIARVVVIILGRHLAAEIHRGVLSLRHAGCASSAQTRNPAPHCSGIPGSREDARPGMTKKTPAEVPGFFVASMRQSYFSVRNQSSTSLWIWSLAKP